MWQTDQHQARNSNRMATRFRARWLILVLIPSALLAAVATSLMIASSSGSITRANYDKIEVGTTTLQEVHDLLRTESISIGRQPGEFSAGGLGERTGGPWLIFPKDGASNMPFPPSCQIGVIVDEHDLVRWKWFYQPTAWDVFDRLVYRIKQAVNR